MGGDDYKCEDTPVTKDKLKHQKALAKRKKDKANRKKNRR